MDDDPREHEEPDLEEADLEEADLEEADLEEAELKDEAQDGVGPLELTVIPAGLPEGIPVPDNPDGWDDQKPEVSDEQ